MWPGPLSSTSTAAYGNLPIPPQPPRPDPGESQEVDRHLGEWCLCALLDCCHVEGTPLSVACRDRLSPHVHAHSGSPASGWLYLWEPGDESWRDMGDDWVLRAVDRNVRYGVSVNCSTQDMRGPGEAVTSRGRPTE